jgi:GntR family transcriptional repressor for pyruvate dehydrogenase complex
VRKATLAADVTHALHEKIINHELPPGAFLPARKVLAQQFGVGMSTIQESIQALTAMGLLDSRPGKGTWVRQDALDTLISPAVVTQRLGPLDVRKLYEARAVVEVALTELAAVHATSADIESMYSALNAMQQALDDDMAFATADMAFHLAVARAGQNELLAEFYSLARRLLEAFIHEVIRLPGVKEEGLAIQRAIADAIAAHDVACAREAARQHMVIIEKLIGRWSS